MNLLEKSKIKLYDPDKFNRPKPEPKKSLIKQNQTKDK